MVRFDKTIPPGGEGKIVISVGAKSCSRGAMKQNLVITNDPMNSAFTLTVTGKGTM